MDAPSGYSHNYNDNQQTAALGLPGPTPRGQKKLAKKVPRAQNPQLFTDISQQPNSAAGPASQYGLGPQPPQPYYASSAPGAPASFPGQQYLSDPMATMAMQYGGNLADQGKEYMQKNLEKYVAASKLKYYFAVDTNYVGKKLGLLLFPFSHTDWSIPYSQDEPVAPRYAINAPDLYIPVMGFVTFVLVSAIALGVQGRFTPETIGVATSSALGYLLLEILVILLSLYILAVQTSLSYLDWTAYAGYKYFGMVLAVLAGVSISKLAYYVVLIYSALALAFFLTRSLKVQILPHSDDFAQTGNKRRLYVLLSLAAIQPVFMWWLTFSFIQ